MAQFKFVSLADAVAKAKEMIMTEEYVTIVKSLEKAVTEPDNEVRYFVEDGEDGPIQLLV